MKIHTIILALLLMFVSASIVFAAPVMTMKTNIPSPSCQYETCTINDLTVNGFTLPELDPAATDCNGFPAHDGEIITYLNTLYICDEPSGWIPLSGVFTETDVSFNGERTLTYSPIRSSEAGIERYRLLLGDSTTDTDDDGSELVIMANDNDFAGDNDGAATLTLRNTSSSNAVYSIRANDRIQNAGIDFDNSFSIFGGVDPAFTASYLNFNTYLAGTQDGEVLFPDDLTTLNNVGAGSSRVQIQKNDSMLNVAFGFVVDATKTALAIYMNDDGSGSGVNLNTGTGLTISASEDSYATGIIMAERTDLAGQGHLHFLTKSDTGSDSLYDEDDHVMVMTDDNQVGIGVTDVPDHSAVSSTNPVLEVNGDIFMSLDLGNNPQWTIDGLKDPDVADPNDIQMAATRNYVDVELQANVSGGCINVTTVTLSSALPLTQRRIDCVASWPAGHPCLSPALPYNAGFGGDGYVSAYPFDGTPDTTFPTQEQFVCVGGCCMF